VLETLALVVRANSVIKGSLDDKDVKILVAPAGPVDIATHAKPSGNQALFFLVAATDPSQLGYYGCVSMAGLVEDTAQGLSTVLDPQQSVIVTSDNKDFVGLVKEVRSLVKA
jgi:hypothetical protein